MPKRGKPLVLLTNDDGVGAPGLLAAYEALRDMGDVRVVAPREEQSSCGHSVTLLEPIFCDRLREGWYAVGGTPADAVFIACSDILPSLPSLVVSGINHGPNLGKDTFYSGTVAAAREGAFRGVPSVAVSMEKGGRQETAVKIVRIMVRTLLDGGLRGGAKPLLFNVNIPSVEPRGFRLTRLGRRVYRDHVLKRVSPRERTYYWINGGPADVRPGRATDGSAVSKGYVSITPLLLDQTDGPAAGGKAAGKLPEVLRKWSRQL